VLLISRRVNVGAQTMARNDSLRGGFDSQHSTGRNALPNAYGLSTHTNGFC
jgi:hypothetical protein